MIHIWHEDSVESSILNFGILLNCAEYNLLCIMQT